jgi:ABC-type lipoprotein export system ATPase subunit
LIRLENIERSYDTKAARTWVLRQITLDIEKGEFVSVMGPSGAGKTTLLNILGMFDGGFEGGYWLNGIPVHELPQKKRADLGRAHIGFVFQQYHLLDDLTVYENLEIPLSYRDVPRTERQSVVADMLDRFGIVGKKDLYPSQLSGGQQQLVAVARAMVANPDLILADEPTGALDTTTSCDVMALLQQLNRNGMTVVLVTHEHDIANFAARIVGFRDGQVVEDRRVAHPNDAAAMAARLQTKAAA